MAALTGEVRTPGGTVPAFPRVTITLYAGSLTVAFAANGTEIVDSYEPPIGTDGSWSATLQPNATITPSGTRYLVEYEAEGKTLARQWVIFPNDGLDHYISEVVSDPPDPIPESTALLRANNLDDLTNLDTALANLGWGKFTRIPAGWGTKWRAARDQSSSRLVKVAVIGDSISVGWVATNWWTNGWVGLLRTALQQAYGDGGSGFITVDYMKNTGNNLVSGWLGTVGGSSQWSRFPDANDNNGRGGINWCSVKNATSGVGTMNIPMWGNNSLKVYALNDPTYGTYSYAINGGTATNVALNAANAVKVTTVASPPAGSAASPYTLNLAVVSGTVELYGAAAYNATGIAVDNLSMAGRRSLDLLIPTPGSSTTQFIGEETPQQLGPWDLVIFALGVNDVRAGDASNVAKNILATWSGIKNKAPNVTAPETLIMICNPGPATGLGGDTTHAEGQMAAEVYKAAQAVGAAVVDVWAFAGRSTEPWNTLGYQSATDVHPFDAGHVQYEGLTVPLLTA